MQSVDLNDNSKDSGHGVGTKSPENGSPSVKYHDTKRFRLRAVGSEYEIYERYFKSGIARKVSLMQMGVAIIIIISQVITMSILYIPTVTETSGAGLWCSVITAFGATVTLAAARKASYCKLHTAMAMHLINVLAHCFFEMCLLLGTIPTIRRKVYATQNEDIADVYRYNYKNYIYDNFNQTTERSPIPARSSEASAELTANTVCLALSAFMSLGGLLQILMSFFMTIKTGRAICCGRAHLEGKFFEIEAAGREDVNYVKFNKDGKEVEVMKSGGNAVSPPPYESGYFPSSLTASNA